MTDPIADLLVRIRNASLVQKDEINIPYSKIKLAILTILQEEGYLRNIRTFEAKKKKMLGANLTENHLSHLKQISKPGRRVYVKSKDIPKPLRGLGLVIMSTPSGIISAKAAIKKGLGGELICEIW
jgi:small subunit ribosomal protein S8